MKKNYKDLKCNEILQITANTWVTGKDDKFDKPALGIINGSDRSLIIDSGTSYKQTEELKTALSNLNISKPEYCIITHSHWDHFLGMNYIDIPTIAHQNIVNKLKKYSLIEWSEEYLKNKIDSGELPEDMIKYIRLNNPELESIKIKLPDIAFDRKLNISLGNIDCIIEHLECDHTDDCIVTYIPQEKILFVGDGIYIGKYNGKYGYTMDKVRKMKAQLLSYDAEYYIISHSDEMPMTRQSLEKELDYYTTVGEIAEKYRTDTTKIVEEITSIYGTEKLDEFKELAQFFINALN